MPLDKEQYDTLHADLTRVIDLSPCDYSDVIEVLRSQLAFVRKARKQEHSKS